MSFEESWLKLVFLKEAEGFISAIPSLVMAYLTPAHSAQRSTGLPDTT